MAKGIVTLVGYRLGGIEDSTRSMPEIESLWQMVCFHKHIESNLIHKLKEAKMVSKTIRFELCT